MSEKNWEEELRDPAKWSTEDEVYLLFCALDNKPVGIDKHLQMSIIWSRFRALTKKTVSSDVLWKKLGSWYNLKHLDDIEPFPFQKVDEDFLLPSEIIPDFYTKYLSEEEKKNIDFSGQFKKFIAVNELDEDDHEYKGKLSNSEKMKWFECPQYYKTDKPIKKLDLKSRLDSNESSNDSTPESKPLRKYGKAGDITSGTILTISVPPQLLDELDDATGDDDNKEDTSCKKQTSDLKEESDRLKAKRKRGSTKRGELPDDAESPAPKQSVRKNKLVESTPTSNTRLRKGSAASNEALSGSDRRCSTRVSSTSESKPDSSSHTKRKSIARR